MMTTKTRFGGNAPGLPGLPPPAPLPGLVSAFSRRRAVFGAVEAEQPSTPFSESPEAAEARALHARRELRNALEYGFALLDALNLPPLALDVIDDGIATLDRMDAAEADLEDDDPLEAVGDDELDLGWSALHSQVNLGDNTIDGDLTALETHGKGFRRSGPDDAEDGADAEETYEDPWWSRGDQMPGSEAHA